jgi:prepilin-type N-terminal cleavage/methylation domain-containing protein
MTYDLRSTIYKGFTLIELMVSITIVGILIGFGISAYGKSQSRQIDQAAGEHIVSLLEEQQKLASIGKYDCAGKYSGQQVILSTSPATIKTRSTCEGGLLGTQTSTAIDGLTTLTAATIVFNPLTRGINLGGPTSLNINYTSTSGLSYRIALTSSGTIDNMGIQP